MIGAGLYRVACAWFEAATVTRVFEPMLADWQRECAERTGVRRAVTVARGYLCFASIFLRSLPSQMNRPVSERTVTIAFFTTDWFVAIGIKLQAFAFFGAPGLGGNLFPALLATALPLAIVPVAILIAAYGRARAQELRSAVLWLALICIVVLIPVLGWIAPRLNQAWREEVYAEQTPLARGSRELTITELFSAQPPPDLMADYAGRWNATRAGVISERLSILLMPLTMAAFGIAVARARRLAWLSALVWWVAAGIIWQMLLFDIRSAPVPDLAWLPHLLLLALAAFVTWRTRRGGSDALPESA